MSAIILFDGVCNLCSESVKFIIKHDPNGYFKFASLQSKQGQLLLKKYQLPASVDSFVLIEKNQAFTKSTAALNVTRNLHGLWRFMRYLKVVPRPVRDFFYYLIAKNRYRLFGRKQACLLPSAELKSRFLK